ncbi:hypothetical protein Ac2012v2_007024 [Leucoagaricus gongylophorus]
MSETVIREVTRDVWIFSKPFSRVNLIPFGGRSTAIKMKDGGVWLLASTPLDEQTKTTLDNLGPVRFIVGADAVHHLYHAQYKKEYPSAILIAPEAVRARLVDKSLKFDGAWGRDPPGTKYGFEDDVTTSVDTRIRISLSSMKSPRRSLKLTSFSTFLVLNNTRKQNLEAEDYFSRSILGLGCILGYFGA